jgi:hypothetical protein
MSGTLPKGFLSFTRTDINRITDIPTAKKILQTLYDDLQKLNTNLNVESNQTEVDLTGFEPTLTKGNLTATSPISVSGSRQVIGGAADISIASTALPHLAYCKANAGAATTIVCYLDTDGTGTEITVNCHIAGGGNLDSAIPRLTDGLGIVVIYIGSSWYCATVFQASINCVCTSP